MQKLEFLVKLHTVQMEGNPVWSSSDYAFHLVTSLPELKILDQQEISPDVRANASKWKQTQAQYPASSTTSGVNATGARKQVLIDPHGRPQYRPVVITIFTQNVRTYVRTSQNFKIKRQFTAGRDCGLAEWIIDDSCFVSVVSSS